MTTPFHRARLRVVLAWHNVRVSRIGYLLGVSPSYVHQQLSGDRPLTAGLLEVLRGIVGVNSDAWRWVTGESNEITLTSPPDGDDA